VSFRIQKEEEKEERMQGQKIMILLVYPFGQGSNNAQIFSNFVFM
jgi:hypothetical protein